jgi:hypothetical protein
LKKRGKREVRGEEERGGVVVNMSLQDKGRRRWWW